MLSVLAKHWSQNGVPHPAAQGPSRQLRLPVRARPHSGHGKALLQKILQTKPIEGFCDFGEGKLIYPVFVLCNTKLNESTRRVSVP